MDAGLVAEDVGRLRERLKRERVRCERLANQDKNLDHYYFGQADALSYALDMLNVFFPEKEK